MTLAIALAVVLVFAGLWLGGQWLSGCMRDPLDRPLSDDWWPKGPRRNQ